MMIIWKYPLEVRDTQIIRMPKGAKILTVQSQRGTPCLWALCDQKATDENRCIMTYGTGNPINSDPGQYIGTYQLAAGDLVFHVFEEAA